MFDKMFGELFSAITDGILVRVRTEFHKKHSQNGNFVFTYYITITNTGSETVQLMRRHWHIYDSKGTYQEVEGEGVIGQQPILKSGQSHKYVSGCHLKSDMGKMSGTYLMKRIEDDTLFEVKIPDFSLIDPVRFN
ncbi:Co2+/Mg2+ efflux protein ApaG [Bernardetia sp. ABR2-2B]|uniref:Co2+/Mg2+ efflux protein ApaG n=1 Tax=Bernardetia sp. ABR2-2B TaxID=3127472 RepID=UPI0030D595D9